MPMLSAAPTTIPLVMVDDYAPQTDPERVYHEHRVMTVCPDCLGLIAVRYEPRAAGCYLLCCPRSARVWQVIQLADRPVLSVRTRRWLADAARATAAATAAAAAAAAAVGVGPLRARTSTRPDLPPLDALTFPVVQDYATSGEWLWREEVVRR